MPKSPKALNQRFASSMAAGSIKSALEADAHIDTGALARDIIAQCSTAQVLSRAHDLAVEMARESKTQAAAVLRVDLPRLEAVHLEEASTEVPDFGRPTLFSYSLEHEDGVSFPIPAGCLMDDIGDLFADSLIEHLGEDDQDVANGLETGDGDAWARAFGRAFGNNDFTPEGVRLVIAMLEILSFDETMSEEITIRPPSPAETA